MSDTEFLFEETSSKIDDESKVEYGSANKDLENTQYLHQAMTPEDDSYSEPDLDQKPS